MPTDLEGLNKNRTERRRAAALARVGRTEEAPPPPYAADDPTKSRTTRRRIDRQLAEQIVAAEVPRGGGPPPDDPTKDPAVRRRVNLLLEAQIAPARRERRGAHPRGGGTASDDPAKDLPAEVPRRIRPTIDMPRDIDPLLDATRVRLFCGGISEMTLHRWLTKRGFPRPDLRVAQRRFWRVSTVEHWIQSQILRPTA
jgi:hypothetical protein